MLVFMTGMMGSGKSTVAKHLSSMMNLPYDDLDHILEAREGRSITDIFETDGESYFRQKERELLAEYCTKQTGIFALGGGALCTAENWELIPDTAHVVWLKASVETLLERLRGDQSRPLLHGDQEEQLQHLMEKRIPFYSRANIQLDTDQDVPRKLAETLRDRLRASS